MVGRRTTATLFFCLATACSLPPFEYEGEHVVVASNVVDQVCAGTIEQLDLAVEYMDEQLALPQTDEKVPVAIVDLSTATKWCGGYRQETFRGGCAPRNGGEAIAVLSPSTFESAAIHEIVHVRVGRHRSGNVALFNEGIAVALSPSLCPQHDEVPPADELLAISSGWGLDRTGYYLGGELVTWLLDTHGHKLVMSFLATLVRPGALVPITDPEFVRSNYRSHFGSDLDEDLYQHLRSPNQISPDHLGCTAPKAKWVGDRVHLEASLDCDSARVQNNFLFPDRGFVEWTLDVPVTETPRHHRLLDNIPTGTWLEIRRCTCDLHDARPLVTWNEGARIGASIELDAGAHLVRWHGRLNSSAELNIAIEAYDDK